MSILLREGAELAFGRQFQNVKLPINGVTDLGFVTYPTYRLLVMAGVAALGVGLGIWMRRSLVGLRLRAMLDKPELAQAMGINTRRLSTGTFVVGCLFAGLAGLILAPTLSISPTMGLDALIRSFFALIVGGLGTLEGLVVGTSLIGGIQSGLSLLMSQTAGYLGVLILALVFIWKRPNGLIHRG